MKSTLHYLSSKDDLKCYLHVLPLLLFCCSCLNTAGLHAQQNSLPCNSITPWIPNTFDVEVEFSSSALACWDGDLLCVIPGSNEPENVVDANLNNFATGEILIGGTLTLSVTDINNVYSAGNFAGFVISSGLLGVDVFSGISIRTYLDNIPVETFQGFDLIGLNVNLFDDPFTVGFVTSSDFDEIEITFATGLGAGLYNVHYAVIERFCAGPALNCNEETVMNSDTFPMTIDYAHTGSIGINLGNVDNPENAISLSTTDYASLNNLANVLDSLSIAIEEQVTDYPAGTFVGFDIENITLAGLDLLENIVITSYLNGVQQEQVSNDNLLLGVPLLNSTGRHTVGFVTTTAVDKVKFTLAQPINVSLGTTRVYSAIFREFCEGPDLPCNEQVPVNSSDYPIYINFENTGFTGAVCGGCTIEDVEAVIDTDPMSYAEIDITAGVLTIGSLSVKKELAEYPANTFAGFRIENINLVDVDVLSGVTISTYSDGSFVELASGTDILLTAGTDLLVNQGEFLVGFVTTAPFDEVRISLTNVGMVNIGTTRIYEVVFGAFCAADIECDTTYYLNAPEFPVYVDFQLTGLEGGVCALCEVEDPHEVITPSNADFASITIPAGVLQTGSIAVRDALYVYPPGTIAGFVIEDLNDLLQADLFASLTISTYLDGDLQEFAFGANLIDAEVLILFINPDAGVYNVGFETTLPFDEIRITVGALASVINLIDVYGAFVDTRNSSGGNGGLDCPSAPVAMDDISTTPEDTPVAIDVLDNDSDSDSPLDIPVIVDPPSNGTALVNPGDSTITYTPDPDFVGVDSFTYSICDEGTPPLCDTATVVVTVTPVIDTIVVVIPEDSTLVVCADDLTTFTEPATNLDLCDLPSNGSVTITGTCATYMPDPGFNGQDTFCVVTCDPNDPLLCDTTIVIVIVDSLNNPPVAVDDIAITPEDIPVIIDVLDNDSDPDSPLNNPVITDPPVFGDVVVNPGDGTVTYTPDPDFVGVDSFMYEICDDGFPVLCDTATVIVTVTPVIDTVYQTIPEDSMFTLCADELTTFTEAAIAIALCDAPANGQVSIMGICATYTPDPDYNGQDTFCLVVCDPNDPLLCDTTIVVVTVDPVNDPPVAVDDMANTPEDIPVIIDVLDNDSDPDSPLNNPVITETPSFGDVVVNPGDGTVTYTPDPDFVGVDSFMYEICDDGLPVLCDTATVMVNVIPVTDTIIIVIPEDSTVVICADSLTTFTGPATNLELCDEPSDGTVTIIGTCATYMPDPGFNGQDTFCVVTCDPNDPLKCDTSIVIIIVDPYNNPPVAIDDIASTPEDVPVIIDVLDNDSDPDSPLNNPVITEAPSNGGVVVNAGDGTVTYTPDLNFVGIDSFMYEICDDGLPIHCDTATVVVTVTPVIDTVYQTIPEDSMFTLCADELTTFTEAAIAVALCDAPANGQVSIMGTCATYTPDPDYNGQDTFCLVVCDPNDPLLCDTTIVVVTIDPVNDPPVAVDDMASTPEDIPVIIDVLDNDSDPDSPLNNPVITDTPSNGGVVVNAGDGSVTYTPDLNFVGVDSFMYEICDDGLPVYCDTATVVVTVSPAIDTIYETIPEDSMFTVCADELTTFTAPATSVALCDTPSNGEVTITGTCATYIPDPGYTGQDTFCLVVCDPNTPMLCDTTIVVITVEGPFCVTLHAFVYLEGASITPTGVNDYTLPMRNTLNLIQVLPGQCYESIFGGTNYTPPGQPYDVAPWNHMGVEGDGYDSGGDPMQGDAGYPPTVVDWVLVSLRHNAAGDGGPICQVAGWLHQDGNIELLDSFECCDLDVNIPYYLVVEHRNHLLVMSHEPIAVVNDTLSYDFRIQQSYISDPLLVGIVAQQKEILPGVYAMYAGNGNQSPVPQADTDINFDDRTFWEMNTGVPGIYNTADYNLNTDTNFNDRVLWERNNGKFSSVPRD